MQVYHVGYWKELHGSLDKFGNYALESTHGANKRVIRSSTNQYSNQKRDKNVMHQILAINHRARGFDRDVGQFNTRKHGNASWLRRSLMALKDPKAKFDWANFSAEYPPSGTLPSSTQSETVIMATDPTEP